MATRLQGVIWDLDGTVADTLPLCIAAFQYAFQAHLGKHVTAAEISALFGVTELGIIRSVSPDRSEEVEQTYLAAYERLHIDYIQPFDGIVNILETIGSRSLRVAMVTGKGRGSTDISLKHLRLARYFEYVEVGSPDGPNKPTAIQTVLDLWRMPSEACAYVGDTPYDMAAAAEVGVIGLGAAWASTATINATSTSPATATFRRVAELGAWLEHAAHD